MPKSIVITAPLREALTACFVATTRLSTGDTDVAAPPEALIDIWKGERGLSNESTLQSHCTTALWRPCRDLLLLRAVTVVDRGGDGDVLDFEWLLSEVVKTGQLPQLDEEELDWLVKAVESRLGTVGRLVVAAMLSGEDAAAAVQLSCMN
ncbi:hypothetical protein CKM354_000216400 [Cercospora kikuchii]|uniref:Uncharacterized protein n=1 Tax=Cercospora kikuchii TaxID=84275 RepID=A0A9P3FDP4_9PEZI|nr:uncharacterized protein CKM354_000216400 [Cercospora kikuchii]GIZ38760.1 hypothetical protein CKM354_000216400 [Cercospora kikuchii]